MNGPCAFSRTTSDRTCVIVEFIQAGRIIVLFEFILQHGGRGDLSANDDSSVVILFLCSLI